MSLRKLWKERKIMENRPIYKRIEEIIQREGRLPEDFTPEEREYKDGELLFAPGALEGILGHHSSGKGEKTDFIPVLKQYVKMSLGEALQDFEVNKADTFKAATMRGSLLQEIINHQVELEASKVANLAYCFVANGRKAETVKLGLTMMALFNFSDNPQVCHMLQTLGYCEDFTDYVLASVEEWPRQQKQDCFFELAKNLYGWGKINVVEMLEADTEEKKQWILCHGCKNSVLNDYLALDCAEKGDLYGRLQKGNLSEEELRGAAEIMEGLIGEGPCKGMSVIDYPVELTGCFLEELKSFFAGCNQKQQIPDIYFVSLMNWINDYFKKSDLENAGDVVSKVSEVKALLDLEAIVKANLAKTPNLSIAVASYDDNNLDISGELMQLLKEDFCKYFVNAGYFLQNNVCVEEFLELCEQKTDANSYDKGMGNLMGLKLKEGQVPMDTVVQYLDRYPLQGKKLIEICMDSPISRWRLVAGKALLGWVDKLNKPLSEIAPDLYSKVMSLHIIEGYNIAKEQWSKLI